MLDSDNFKLRLKLARLESKMSQTELAQAVGVSQVLICQMETENIDYVNLELVEKLSIVLNKHAAWLVFGEGPERIENTRKSYRSRMKDARAKTPEDLSIAA